MLPQNLDLELLTCGEECLSIQTLPVRRGVKDAYGCCRVSGRSSSLRCNSLEAEGMAKYIFLQVDNSMHNHHS